MGQRNQGIFSIEKTFAINRDCSRVNYFNRLTALIYIYSATAYI
jgi:hypothetical protein